MLVFDTQRTPSTLQSKHLAALVKAGFTALGSREKRINFCFLKTTRRDYGKLISVDDGIPEALRVKKVSFNFVGWDDTQIQRVKDIYEAFADREGFNIAWIREGRKEVGYYRHK